MNKKIIGIILIILTLAIIIIFLYQYNLRFYLDPGVKENKLVNIPQDALISVRPHRPEQINFQWSENTNRASYRFSFTKSSDDASGKIYGIILVDKKTLESPEDFLDSVKQDIYPFFKNDIREPFLNITYRDVLDAKKNESIVLRSDSLFLETNSATISISSNEQGYINQIKINQLD